MKLISTILLLVYFNANATIYYVSNTGSDAANGTSSGTAWQTIAKVNSSSFSAGDQILFKKGDVWNEKLLPPSSGTIGNVITFGSYGTGVKPVISGFESITLADQGGNIWSGTATNSILYQNTVYINGAVRAKGRYPNSSVLTFTSIPTTTTIVIPHGVDYTGKEIVVRDATWILDVAKVTSQNSGVTYDTLNLYPAITYAGGALGGTTYFFQNHTSYLDSQNEWSYDSTTKLLSVYSTSLPTVKFSKLDTLVYFRQKRYLTFDGINFEGANKYAINFDSSDHIIITNCHISNNSGTAVFGNYVNTVSVTNDSLTNILSNGVFFANDTSITNSGNYLKNIGHFSGMGVNGNSTYIGMFNQGLSHTYYNNKLDSCGYMGIYWKGKYGLVQYNYITNYGSIKQDGGGIYTYVGIGLPSNFDSGTVVKKNIILNGLGINQTFGIYLDITSSSITIDSNLSVNTSGQGGALNGYNNTFTNNTLYDTLGHGGIIFGSAISNYVIKKNTIYTNGVALLFPGAKDTLEIIDSNFYRTTTAYPYGMASIYREFDTWKIFTGYDTHSDNTLPYGITSSIPVIIYNNTLTDSTVTLSTGYYDFQGNGYAGSLVLHPFQFKMLFPSTYRNPVPLSNLKFRTIRNL